ncbi:MAG TPA: hypothetical protein VL307_10940 [Chitinophagaceae bacterium]|nr:hypothetical protein [Chitinophagaceae bacterium]
MNNIFLISLLSISFLACTNNAGNTLSRQEQIKQEIDQVKADYFKQTDSLEAMKMQDTSAAHQSAIAAALIEREKAKNEKLIPLQKAYDSLAGATKK